ncbi:MAG: CapA family protein [Spirochaetaceae bacterium]|jgi:poly-gamma-glutamate synthesis protein (capsule biosynthesis protein)|nr:CapA family protein [Spirochaetaceae bacterium]
MRIKPPRRIRYAVVRHAAVLAAAFTLCAACAGLRDARRADGGRSAAPKAGVREYTLTIAAVGDNLIHAEILEDARHDGDDDFDFHGIYTPVLPLVQGADIAFVNQETLIAGRRFGLSGYPTFNGPPEVGEALVRAGFDVVNHATNHAMDKGEAAVYAVLDFWDKHPAVRVLGLRRNETDEAGVIIEKKHIKTGWLAYTYGTNGIPLPKDKPYLVSLINTERMAREIDRLRPLCDFLVVSMHWGEEYQHAPSKRQLELAEFLAAHNVDLVLGHHPHVVQPARTFARPFGGETLVFFSLGNFFSSQKEFPRLLGALARVTIRKTDDGHSPPKTAVSAAEIIPLVTHYESGFRRFKVYPLEKYPPELLRRHGLDAAASAPAGSFEELFGRVFAGPLAPVGAGAR